MRRLATRTRLLITLGGILLVGFGVTSVAGYLATARSVRSSVVGEILPLVSDSIYSEIQWNLLRPIHNSSLIDTFLKD